MTDIANIEKASAQIDAFIERRSKGSDHANAVAMAERGAQKSRERRIREENRLDWVRHYRGLARAFHDLAAINAAKADALAEGEGGTTA